MKHISNTIITMALILFAMLIGCAKTSHAGPATTDSYDDASLHSAALWSEIPDSLPWTLKTLEMIRKNKPLLDTAQDIDSFCTDYSYAPVRLQEICWLRIIGAMVKFESNFKPDTGFRENDGNLSIGLMQMSVSECPNARSANDLRDPLINLECGINKFARMTYKYGHISGQDNIGAAKTWSVLREPYQAYVKSLGQYVWLGRKDKIIALSSTYSTYD